jgi:hypothetical protein
MISPTCGGITGLIEATSNDGRLIGCDLSLNQDRTADSNNESGAVIVILATASKCFPLTDNFRATASIKLLAPKTVQSPSGLANVRQLLARASKSVDATG